MVDRHRVLAKLDELDQYLGELKSILPGNFKEYQAVEKKRSCERLLQLSVECAIDICKLLVSGLKLGLPAGESDLFVKLLRKKLISSKLCKLLKEMRGFRNILVHEYAEVDDELVYEMATKRLKDFRLFKKEVLKSMERTRT